MQDVHFDGLDRFRPFWPCTDSSRPTLALGYVSLSLSPLLSLSLSFTQTHNKNITTGREECGSVYVEQDLYGSVSFDRSLSILYSRQMDEETHASTST